MKKKKFENKSSEALHAIEKVEKLTPELLSDKAMSLRGNIIDLFNFMTQSAIRDNDLGDMIKDRVRELLPKLSASELLAFLKEYNNQKLKVYEKTVEIFKPTGQTANPAFEKLSGMDQETKDHTITDFADSIDSDDMQKIDQIKNLIK